MILPNSVDNPGSGKFFLASSAPVITRLNRSEGKIAQGLVSSVRNMRLSRSPPACQARAKHVVDALCPLATVFSISFSESRALTCAPLTQ